MADEYDDDLPADASAGLASGIVVVTGLILIAAIFTMFKAAADIYGTGPLS